MKFNQGDIVNIKGTIGKWIVLTNTYRVNRDSTFIKLSDSYTIQSLDYAHSNPIQDISEDELSLESSSNQ